MLRGLSWIVAVGVSVLLLLQLYFFLQIGWWVHFNPGPTHLMQQQQKILQEKNPQAQIHYAWAGYNQISVHLKKAIIASEDGNFVEHEGIDWQAVERAYQKNLHKGKVVAGGSTITQQLAKNLFLSPERSYLRKIQEAVLAYMLEFWMNKRRIFEIYLNVVEWGNGIFGAEAAAQHYYGVPAAALTSSQAARLAAMLPKPRFYDSHRDSSYLTRRTNLILRRMQHAELP